MIKIEQVLLDKLTSVDLDWLEKGCFGAYDKATSEHQLDAARRGDAWFFRLSGDVEGLFVLARGNIKEKELVMTAVAGKRLIRNFPELYKKVTELARSVGAKRLVGYVSREGLVAIYKNRTKALSVATLFSEELK